MHQIKTFITSPIFPKRKIGSKSFIRPQATNVNAKHIDDFDPADTDILLLSYDNICNVVGNLCWAINKYTPYKARYATACRSYIKNDMDLDLFVDKRAINGCLKNASVVVWTDILHSKREWFTSLYKLNTSYLNNKRNVHWFHGSVLRSHYPLDNFHQYVFVSTPDLIEYAPRAQYLPNVVRVPDIPITKPDKTEIIQCLTVTNKIADYVKTIKKPHLYPKYSPEMDIKSSVLFKKIMTNISKKIDVDWASVSHLSLTDCLLRKARTSMMFDQMWLGSYGVNAIESLYLKKPVVARLSKHTRKCYEEWANDVCPVLQIEFDTAEADMIRHLTQEHDVDYCKKWVDKAHSPIEVARYFTEILMSRLK